MHSGIRNTMTVFKREFRSYFESPVAYVFIMVFLGLLGFLTFSPGTGYFFERRVADLEPFFRWHPWVFLLLVPATTMGLWAKEHASGTLELLLTLPVTMTQAILGKFLAAWLFIGAAIALTIPVMVGTVAFLGDPDGGVIVTAYIGSFLLAGACVSIGMLTSSLTRDQVIGFVLALVACFMLLLAGMEPVTSWFTSWAPPLIVDAVAGCSLLTHYQSLQRGILDVADIAYYLSLMAVMIMTTYVVLDTRKGS
jgi:ABC-2 type transport system permease protein